MKKIFLLFTLTFITTITAQGGRGVTIGYIDMEYILEKVGSYAEANNQLELKAQKWNGEIVVKQNEIAKLKSSLTTERALLTKELIEEREEEIEFQEQELIAYQQKRFGPQGDLISQKSILVKPLQDLVFNAVQEIAEKRKLDFVFDKSSDMTMLFASQKFDISDLVIRTITRAESQENLSKKELEKRDAEDAKEDKMFNNPALEEKEKQKEKMLTEREALLAERKAKNDSIREARKQAIEEKRAKILKDREDKKNGTVIENDSEEPQNKTNTDDQKQDELSPAEKRAALIEEKKKAIADKKAEMEARRAKILAEREAAKKAKEEKQKE